jgi:hypothetical protein
MKVLESRNLTSRDSGFWTNYAISKLYYDVIRGINQNSAYFALGQTTANFGNLRQPEPATSRDSSVGMATRLRTGRSGFQDSITGGTWEFFSSPPRPERLWGPHILPSLGVKRPGREVDHSPPSSAEVKQCVELYLHSPIRFYGVVLC